MAFVRSSRVSRRFASSSATSRSDVRASRASLATAVQLVGGQGVGVLGRASLAALQAGRLSQRGVVREARGEIGQAVDLPDRDVDLVDTRLEVGCRPGTRERHEPLGRRRCWRQPPPTAALCVPRFERRAHRLEVPRDELLRGVLSERGDHRRESRVLLQREYVLGRVIGPVDDVVRMLARASSASKTCLKSARYRSAISVVVASLLNHESAGTSMMSGNGLVRSLAARRLRSPESPAAGMSS